MDSSIQHEEIERSKRQLTNEEQYIKERFQRDFLPKYGTLWRSMIHATQSINGQEESSKLPAMDFLAALQSQQSVTRIQGGKHLSEDPSSCICCDCSPPKLDWEQQEQDEEVRRLHELGDDDEDDDINNKSVVCVDGNSISTTSSRNQKATTNVTKDEFHNRPNRNQGFVDMTLLDESVDKPSHEDDSNGRNETDIGSHDPHQQDSDSQSSRQSDKVNRKKEHFR